MDTQKNLYAKYADTNYALGHVNWEVDSLQDAVDVACELGSTPFFILYEDTDLVHEGKVFKSERNQISARIYTNTDEVLTLDDVIKEREAELDAESSSTLKNDFSKSMGMSALQNIIERLKSKPAGTAFIRENGQRGEYIELDKGEMVFNSEGQQLWPKDQMKLKLVLAPDTEPDNDNNGPAL